ncbi:MAG: UDP-N-acetylmuramate dehydrogenase [Acidobacteria bacterium]|nr:UDP-N-acetylmuramate dehydrogenase [Acidobacteriota bacterium]
MFAIEKNVPLAEFTTFKIGGKARFFIQATNETEIIKSLEFAEQNNLKVFILGGGSNVLIADKGFDGLVLQVALKGVSTFAENDETVFVTAQAGEDWDEFVAFCVERNLQGIECLSGIPGFVGGTPIQNVGAYGQEVSESIVLIRIFDRQTKEIKELINSECGFAYRTSIFNSTEKNRYIVLAVTYALKFGGEPKIVYADLKKHFADSIPNLKETRKAVCEIRATKSMLVRQGGADAQSAGSFFKNPIVSAEKFAEIEKNAENLGVENVPSYKVDDQNVKIPAAWLIENAGFRKGFIKGNVGLSTKHTLALTNRGQATAKEILNLMEEIQKKVEDRFGIVLKPEPVFVGFEK